MRTIFELTNQPICVKLHTPHKPQKQKVCSLFRSKKSHRPAGYEDEVFNFLLKNKKALGIRRIFRFKNLSVDGEIELSDGKILAIEIKLCMNWLKACQSGWQFSRFLKYDEARTNPVNGAIVFFEKFTADWARKAKSKAIENGWNYWYAGHHKVDRYRIDLVRICKQKLEYFPTASGS